jgi:hypothetical protein
MRNAGKTITKKGQPDGSYGLVQHALLYGAGENKFRTVRFAQPRALRLGDILATGDRVLSDPHEVANGSVELHLTGGHEGHRIEVPARIPIALLTEAESLNPLRRSRGVRRNSDFEKRRKRLMRQGWHETMDGILLAPEHVRTCERLKITELDKKSGWQMASFHGAPPCLVFLDSVPVRG